MHRQPTIHQISWFLDLNSNNQLNLNPPYQRKSVWSTKDKKFFLDTIFRNYPTPPIFLHRELDDYGKSTYHVVDGKQRLETLLQFVSNKIAIDNNFGDQNINGKKLKDLPIEYKRKFWDYILVVDYVDSIDGNSINDIFDRVNRNAKNLEPQELRHARYDGWFIKLVEDEAFEGFWSRFKISTKGREKRMKNVQFISELFLIIIDKEIVGFSQDYLDKRYAELELPEEDYPDFDSEDFISDKEEVKHLIKAIDDENNCVTDYAKSQANFYTLWVLPFFNKNLIKTIGAKDYAWRYAEFMSKVNEITPDGGDIIDQIDMVPYVKYAAYSGGASTDYTPRNERLQAITTILL